MASRGATDDHLGICPGCRWAVAVHSQSGRMVKHTVDGRKRGPLCSGWGERPMREAA